MKYLNVIAFLSFVLLISCQSKDQSKERKISSSGKSGELLVIANEGVWESQVGDTVRSFFNQDMPGLSTSEPLYDVVQIPHNALNKMFQTHRNILMLETDRQIDSAVVEFRQDVWSQPQTLIRVRFPDAESLKNALGRYGRLMLQYYNDAEMRRIIKAFRNVENPQIRPAIKRKLAFSLSFPKGYYIGREEPDFMWIRQITNDYNLEIMLHVFRYEDTAVFFHDNVIHLRNELGKKYVPGPSEGSYMGTEQLLSPDVRRLQFNGMYASETRGLWKIMNHPGMGGPYLNYTILDETTNRIIFLDGMVYYPNREKRDLMRQIEGIFRSLEIPVQ